MRWVQQHISAFGGDPTQVTINGQSAGGSSIELHLVAPQNGGLFNRAIAQSVYRTPLPTPEQQEVRATRQFLLVVAKLSIAAFIQLLRGESWVWVWFSGAADGMSAESGY